MKFLLTFLLLSIDTLLYILLFYFSAFLFGSNPFTLQEFSFIIVIILLLSSYEKIYSLRYDFWQETYKLLKALLLSYVISLALLTFIIDSVGHSSLFISFYFLLAFIVLPISKRLIKRILYKNKKFRTKVLIIGKDIQVDILKKEFEQNWYIGLEYSLDDYEMVIISSEKMELWEVNQEIEKYLHLCRFVYVVPYVRNINFAHSNIMEYSNIRCNTIQIENRLLLKRNIWIKNSFDFLVSSATIPFFLCIHLIIAFLIKRDSKGSIFFKQKRLGKDNKVFECYKYRSMYENSDIILQEYLKNNPDEVSYYEKYHKYKNDPRITKIGKFLRASSLDELPQILNIIRLEMSFVGPRPYMLNEAEELGEYKHFILKVRPGITGLWQVNGRNELTFKERNELEVWYIKNWSLWIDTIILIKTVKVVLFKIGAK